MNHQFVPSTARRRLLLALLWATIFVLAPLARAGLISTVVEGPANAPNAYNLTIEFGNGNYYNFILRSTQASYTGYDFINAVAALSSGATKITLDQRDGGSLGFYLNGITVGNDTNSGFVNNSYWAYWLGSATTPVQWTSSGTGESGRMITPGQADGWVYSDGTRAPQATAFAVPEPGTWALLVAGAVGVAATAQRRSGRLALPVGV